MSFDKYMGKEHRKPYRGAKAIDTACRNHKGCPYCLGNRLFSKRKRIQSAIQQLKDWSEWDDGRC